MVIVVIINYKPYVYIVVARVVHPEPANLTNIIDAENSPQGYIVSHSHFGKEGYPENINSSLRIVNIKDNSMLLEFQLFELETYDKSSKCDDYLTIASQSSVQKFCEVTLPKSIPISTKEVLLTFITNNRQNGKGFMLRYKSKYTQ